MACESMPPEWLIATKAPARINSLHLGGTATSAMRLDMDRLPRERREGRSPAPEFARKRPPTASFGRAARGRE